VPEAGPRGYRRERAVARSCTPQSDVLL